LPTLDKVAVLVVQLLAVQGEASHTQRPDYFSPVVRVAAEELAMGGVLRLQHLNPVF
jgi:hypothetical protein